MSEKVCTCCGAAKPETPEFFYRKQGSVLESRCKVCRSRDTRGRRAARRAAMPPKTEKACPGCGRILPLTLEYFWPRSLRGGRRSRCKSCLVEYHREYVRKNRERILTRTRELARQKRAIRDANRLEILGDGNPWRARVIRNRRILPDRERIWTNVRLDRATGCWNWQNKLMPNGYGVVGSGSRLDGTRESGGTRRVQLAHRLAYETFNGPIPDGLFVMHSCDNRRCCNPEHLTVGTQADNIQDAVRRGRASVGEHHPSSKLTGEQVVVILRESKAGVSRNQLAERFSVTRSTIIGIVQRKRWKHIEVPA